jgi:hypothetical protein
VIPYETAPPGTTIDKQCLWPPRCTLSFYDGSGTVLGRFGQRWRRLDLSDTLMLNHNTNSRVVYFGVTSRSVSWQEWDEDRVYSVERNMRHDLGMDGYKVTIQRTSALGAPCKSEFIWKLSIRST